MSITIIFKTGSLKTLVHAALMNGVNFTGANKLLPKLTKSLVNGLVINFVISIKQNLYFVNPNGENC